MLAAETISDLTGFALLQLGSALNVVHAAQSPMDGAARRDGRIFRSDRCAWQESAGNIEEWLAGYCFYCCS